MPVVKAETIAAVLQGIKFVHIAVGRPVFWIAAIVVDRLPVAAGGDRRVIFGFVAAFYFQRMHADVKQAV